MEPEGGGESSLHNLVGVIKENVEDLKLRADALKQAPAWKAAAGKQEASSSASQSDSPATCAVHEQVLGGAMHGLGAAWGAIRDGYTNAYICSTRSSFLGSKSCGSKGINKGYVH